MKHYRDWDSGYSKEQSTRPQTIGYGLVDSPAGLCAWIVEKFWSWTDCDGDPANVLTRDEMLDNIMLYWLPGTGASLGPAVLGELRQADLAGTVQVPVGCSVFPKEIFRVSRRWAEKALPGSALLERAREGRPFRRVRAARHLRRRGPRRFPLVPVRMIFMEAGLVVL